MATHPIQASRLPASSPRPNPEWAGLLKMAPAAVDLVSARNLAHQGLELLSNAANGRRFLSVMTSMQAQLRDAGVPVLVDESKRSPRLLSPDALTRPQRRWLGQVALELYFAQLFRSEVTILDLWPSHFGVDDSGDAVWSPRPFYLRWDAGFRNGLRNVYAGFFLDEKDRFDRGIRELGLEGGATALLDHLGDGNQRSVRFDREKLESTLQAMSKARGPRVDPLHRNFAAFGLYITALHEQLGPLGLAFDVRSAFMRTWRER